MISRNYYKITNDSAIRIDSRVPISQVSECDDAIVYIVNRDIDYLDFAYYTFLALKRDIINSIDCISTIELPVLPMGKTLCYIYNIMNIFNNSMLNEHLSLYDGIKDEYNTYVGLGINDDVFNNIEVFGGGELKTFLYKCSDGKIYFEAGERFNFSKHDIALFLKNYENIVNEAVSQVNIENLKNIVNTITSSNEWGS